MRDLLAELNIIFREVFDNDELVVGRDTTADDVSGWDSVMHVSLILRVETTFHVRFTSLEVADLKSVGDLVDVIRRRLGAA